jgi:hypothetical protein
MTPTLSGFAPVSSLSVLVEMAVKRRHALLAYYLLLLPIVFLSAILWAPLVDSGFEFEVVKNTLVEEIFSYRGDLSEFNLVNILVLLLFVELIMLYGGGAVGPPSDRRANRLRTLREGPWLRWLLRRSGLVMVIRWFLPIIGSIVQMSTVLSVLLVGFLDITERRVGVLATGRALTDDAFLSGLAEASICFLYVGLPVSLFIVAGVCVFRTDRFKKMSQIFMISWALSLYAALLWSVLAGLHVAVFGQEATGWDAFFLLVAWIVLLLNSGAALRLLFLRARMPDSSPEPPAARAHRPVKGGVNLSSARVFAVVLLVVCYVAVNVAVEQTAQMGQIQGARQMFAAHYIADSQAQKSDTPNVGLPLYLGTPTIKKTILSDLFGPEVVTGVEVVQIDGERWRAVDPRLGSDVRQKAMDRLLAIALGTGIDVKAKESFYQLFGRVQKKLLTGQKQVSVPLVGLQVDAGYAAWALAALTLVLLLLIRSRVRRVFLDPEFAIEQPWLVLDWHTRIERVAAVTWLLLVLIGPWVVSVALAVTLAVQISAEGAITSLPGDILRVSLMLSLLGLSACTALLTVLDLHCLRTLRLHYLNDVERG